jgi:hypothetical protein
MRFPTLYKKELREIVPWLILAVLLLLVIGWLMIHMKAFDQRQWYYGPISNGKVIDNYMIFRTDILLESAVLMFFTSIGLGLILGIRHFWVPDFTRTWQFLIHRSATRSLILSAKLAAAATVLLCLSVAWLLLAGYAHLYKGVIVPPESGIVALGIFYAYLGFIVYLGTALCALTTTRWYTTRMFGLFFVFIMFIIIVSLTNFTLVFFTTVFFLTVLIIQIYETFLRKEF